MKRFIAGLCAVVAMAVVMPAAADAHYVMHSYEAQAITNNDGYAACTAPNSQGWSCFQFPVYQATTPQGDGHTWYSWVTFVQAKPDGSRRNCQVTNYFTHGQRVGGPYFFC